MVALKKILIVEDNPINRMMLSEILSAKYQVLQAENGQEALSVLKEHREEVSLILLDIVMPVMDGYTFLSVIKNDPAYASIPVIVTTQSDSESDEVAALSHGATDFVAKPYRPQVILHRVASIINLRETAAMINQFQYDRLTGLYSKEFFYQRVKDILVQHPDREYDIISSDIENFKLINDVFGIPAGDRLLRGVAQLYAEMAGERGICGRFNADQFSCLLERGSPYSDQRFSLAAAKINELSNTKNVVIKWGVYSIEDRTISVEQMCDRALLAARSIKGQYGKHFAIYDDELRNKLLQEQAITDGMESALAQGQFEIYMQPKYRIRDDRLAGVEALVRWNDPERGLQPPGEFIPLFERNGFITKLDLFVWDRVCSVLQEWDEKGYPRLSVSVNVSRADIYNADLADILVRTIRRYHLEPYRLHLEITESAYTENPSQIIETVGHLRELGFVIEMDDFGSGYSSLNMLNQMPLDILKLDMKFIQSETAKPANQGILHFIMGIARSMNLSVVAEGVETREQLGRLRAIGCDYVQGYYFAKPMPCPEFETLMQEQETTVEPDEAQKSASHGEQRAQFLLVADEDARYRDAVKKTFEGRYGVVEAATAAAALECLTGNERKLAAVILSMTMPDGDGLTVLEALQREKPTWNVPVIATGPPDALLEDRALKHGADDYADKPHLQSSLLRRVQRALGSAAAWERERMLQDEVYRDYLTGLINRGGLDLAVEALRGETAPMSVFLFDLDHLDRVNDAHGHMMGDRLIRHFSELLRSHIRSTDVLARFGGDEFVVIMRQMGSADDALKKGEDICRAVREGRLTETAPITCTAGVAVCNPGDSIDAAIGWAEQALREAKRGAEGGCRLWRRQS